MLEPTFDPLALVLTPQIGPKRLQKALGGNGSVDGIAEILGPEIALAYAQTLREQKAEREREKAGVLGVRIIGVWEEAYPEALRQLDSPPGALWLQGELPPATAHLGIVGTRKASPWAVLWTHKVALDLAKAGVGVISGLARGIDTVAHKGALEAGGYTLGVLGSAVDRLYPAENRALAEQMSVLSEFPLGTPPQAELFPRRNHIIAALSKAVLVWKRAKRAGLSSPRNLPSSWAATCWRCPGGPVIRSRWAPTNSSRTVQGWFCRQTTCWGRWG